jgi:hypothetical protein
MRLGCRKQFCLLWHAVLFQFTDDFIKLHIEIFEFVSIIYIACNRWLQRIQFICFEQLSDDPENLKRG